MEIKFGTDGWRAVIGEDYTFLNVAKVLQAFCDLQAAGRDKTVFVGYDRRFQSRAFAERAVRVLLGNGFKVQLAKDFCPTPCISWMTKARGGLAGVVITASHNPFQWNGVKFKEGYGGSASPEFTARVEERIRRNDLDGLTPRELSLKEGEKSGLLGFFDPHGAYLGQLKKLVDLNRIRRAKLKIVADPIYGAGSGFFAKLLGKQVVEIRGEANPGFGGVNPEPIEKNLKLAAETVRRHKAHIGLATDGDADRIGAIDEQGRFVDSHHIFALILRHLVEVKKWKGAVIKTVSTTNMISRLARQYGLELVETPIGFKYICQEFLKTNPLMGGEESGGIGIARHVFERDGILCGLLLLEIVAHHRKPLSKIIAGLQAQAGPLRFQRDDLHIPLETIAGVKAALAAGETPDFGRLKLRGTNFRDGFKFEFEDDGWLLIRPSGTEPLLRVYAEAPSEKQALGLLKLARRFLQRLG
ncbi:MAG: phosphoglucomutase/phosphomannomutase family protein [Deltaproteobacteria bacterium]|nr:phosphoglucomutase/phosphomannomutase family protein [Deltaproteobacteria bacterium]